MVGLWPCSIVHVGDRHVRRARDQAGQQTLGDPSKCCTTTKAMPVSSGRCRNSSKSASKPPAEAPTPTIGHIALGASRDIADGVIVAVWTDGA